MARSAMGRGRRVAYGVGLVFILLGVVTAAGGYLVGAVVAWATPGCGDAAGALHCGGAGNSIIYGAGGIAAVLLAVGAGLLVHSRR